MSLDIISIKDYPDFKDKAIKYCENNWKGVLKAFTSCIEEGIGTINPLPNTFLLLKENIIIGFYQLSLTECIMRKDLSPWFTTLFIDERERGHKLGAMLLEHGRKVIGDLGFEKLYLTTDHIQYYEKYGFREIGLDNFEWGRPTKLYENDAITDIHYVVYKSLNEKSDESLANLARFRWNTPVEKIQSTVNWMKENHIGEGINSKWFEITAFNSINEIVGFIFFMRNPQNLKNWYMGDLSVTKSYQKRGIATNMIKKGLGLIATSTSGGDYVYTYIENNNLPSIKLHEKLGFKNKEMLLPFANLYWSDDQTTYEFTF